MQLYLNDKDISIFFSLQPRCYNFVKLYIYNIIYFYSIETCIFKNKKYIISNLVVNFEICKKDLNLYYYF